MPKPTPPMHFLAVALLRSLLKEWWLELTCGSLIIFTAVIVVLMLPAPLEEPEARTAGPAPQCLPEEQALGDISSDGGLAGLPLPKDPAPWQKPPPCMRGEHSIMGACYQRYLLEDMAPPCEPGIFVWQGQCWRPIRRAERKPASIQP